MTFEEFIESKGHDALMRVRGAKRGTISSWKSRGFIPRSVWPNLMLAFPEIGLRELMEMEAESKSEEV